MIMGTFEIDLNEDKKHGTLVLHFDTMPEEIIDWLRFTYCKDIVWRHHAGNLGCVGGTEYFSTVKGQI